MEIEPLLREAVLEARGVGAVAAPFEDTVLDEPSQAFGEEWAGDSEVGLEVREAARAEERLAQDEQRPAVSHHGKAASH